MRKIKEVKVILNAAMGSVNTASHFVVLNHACTFNVEANGEEVYKPGEGVVRITSDKKPKKELNKKPEPEVMDELIDFGWIWSTMGREAFTSKNRNHGLKGNKLELTYPKVLEGGGLAWIEPFYPEYEPTNKTPNGYFVAAKGDPKILSAVWREYSAKNDGRIINGNLKKFNESVQLHIYTQGLYGHDIIVTLMDRDFSTFNDVLVLDNKAKYGDPVAFYTSEVRAYAILDDEQKMDNKIASSMSPDGKVSDKKKLYVQKTIIDVYIEEGWIKWGGERLKIYPKVKILRATKEEEFLDTFINVQGMQKEDSPLTMTGNKPVVVDEIPTEIANYHACKYLAVILSIPEKDQVTLKDKIKQIYLYEQGSDTHRNLRSFEVVTGETEGLQKIKIELTQVTTLESDCTEPTGKKHEGRVLKLISYPETIAEKNNPKSVAKESSWGTPMKAQIDILSMGIATEEETGDTMKLEVFSQTDSEIEFNARYIYNKKPIVIELLGKQLKLQWILRYFWMGKFAKGKPYIVLANTCRHQQEITIYPYPDVAWELSLELKVFKEEAKKNYSGYEPAPSSRHKALVGVDWSFDFGLHATWNGEEKFDLTTDLRDTIFEKLKRLGSVGNMVKGLLFGEKNSDDSGHTRPNAIAEARFEEAKQKFGDQKEVDRIRKAEATRVKTELNDERKKLSQHAEGSDGYKDALTRLNNLTTRVTTLKRDLVGYDIIWPELNATFNWHRENTNSQQRDDLQNQTGLVFSGHIEAKPLIGLEAFFDFLALIQRAHPIALAVIAAIDLAMDLIGDGSKIVCEFRAKGSVGGKLQGFFNTLTLENSFNKADRDRNGKPLANFTGEVEFTLMIQIKIEVRKDYILVAVEGTAEASIAATAKLSGRAVIGYDTSGFYTEYYGTFEGLEVIGKLKVEGSAKMDKKKTNITEDVSPVDEKKSDEHTLIKGSIERGIKYQAIDKMEEVILGRVYFGVSE